jgi:beta-mannosidase
MAENNLLITQWKFDLNGQKLSAKVPGDISADLMDHGIIQDVLFGDNYKDSAWVHERAWDYYGFLNINKDQLSAEKLQLVFYGVDTYASVYLNDILIGQTTNMFMRYDFKIKDAAKEGENIIKVAFSPIRDVKKLYKNDKYPSCFDDNRIFMRKVQCHFGWDWAPNFPGLGIYEKVELVWGDNKNIDWVQVRTDNSGAVCFITELSSNGEGSLTVEVEKAPNSGFENIYSNTVQVTGKKNIANIYVDSPQLWYPVGYGESPIYRYRIIYSYKDGQSIKSGTFAFRDFIVSEKSYQTDKLTFDMTVNEKPFRVVGSNWVPASIMTGCIDNDAYDRLLADARDCGINMLRVWGGGLYEKDVFYEKCDKYGITVWQDFMFSCCSVPDDINDFCDVIKEETEYQIKRLRNHPSIVIWCGGNELTDSFRYVEQSYGKYINRVMLAGLVYDLDGTRKYVWDSPYSLTEIGDNVNSGDCHKNALSVATAHNDIINFRKYQFNNDNAFDTECAVLGMCRIRSLKKFMPEDKIWPQNDLWEDRFSCNPYDDSVVSFTERLNMNVTSMFGYYDNLNDYVKKSMTVHAEVLRAEIEYFRSVDRNNGIMNWMYNDIWGNGTWAIVDYYGEKKPAYYAMKRAGSRLSLSIVMKKDGYKIYVVNDTDKMYEEPITLFHQKLNEDIISTQTFKARVIPFTKQSFDIKFDENIKNAYLYAETDKLNTVYFYDLWKDKTFETDLNKKILINSDKKSGQIYITANKFARMVFIDFPEGYRINLSDNYFDIPKGKTSIIEFVCEKEINESDISILTFADEWEL